MFENFKFRRFNPSPEIILHAGTMLSEVMDLAPDNSTCQASMAKFGNIFSAWIEITSPAGHFLAEARSEDPRLTLDILDDRIKLKIKKWKTMRRLGREDREWPAYAS